ncbi:MAG TPA: ABC transporter permease subunit [Gammaproteobacteria bacterium]|nr:ABC transporter permease subunit [Gammaproteobacteria bacterium]
MTKNHLYAQPKESGLILNKWDVLILTVFFGILAALVWGTQQMKVPYELGDLLPISLDPKNLPQYAIRTILRMAIALAFSLLFTFTIGTLAAKSKKAERIIIPFIDIMQSVPILGFLSISIIPFMVLFPGSLLGPECAAIFAIFTSQVWNMALCFYQSLRTLPNDLLEATHMLQLTQWQRFWRLEVPYAFPSLLWNIMMSLSAGWFFVVASEAFSVASHTITLPGIGSYIWIATENSNYQAIFYAILCMFVVIILYDQLIFRPLVTWSEKFKMEPNPEIESEGTWFLNLLTKTQFIKLSAKLWHHFKEYLINPPQYQLTKDPLPPKVKKLLSFSLQWFITIALGVILFISIFLAARFIFKELLFQEVLMVFYFGLITTLKVTILIVLASLIWVPIGVWIGLSPRVASFVQPVAQILAAFPANLMYPLLFMFITQYHLNVEIWTSPLMILGTQWYILFNVIAGSRALPMEIRLAVENYGVKGWLKWRKFILPGIFPYFVTGAMTAAGGCWNASIIADVVSWGGQTLHATGLGGYITQYFTTGDFARVALGIGVMCLYVTIINRLLWQKLYNLSETRYSVSAQYA